MTAEGHGAAAKASRPRGRRERHPDEPARRAAQSPAPATVSGHRAAASRAGRRRGVDPESDPQDAQARPSRAHNAYARPLPEDRPTHARASENRHIRTTPPHGRTVVRSPDRLTPLRPPLRPYALTPLRPYALYVLTPPTPLTPFCPRRCLRTSPPTPFTTFCRHLTVLGSRVARNGDNESPRGRGRPRRAPGSRFTPGRPARMDHSAVDVLDSSG